jgi:hypothetical protein
MVLIIFLGFAGVCVIVFAVRRFGFSRVFHTGAITRPTLVMLLGLGLIAASFINFLIELDHRGQREKLDGALIKMFGRLPDELELEGDRLGEYQGIARYDAKRYRIESKPTLTSRTDKQDYEITATPLK